MLGHNAYASASGAFLREKWRDGGAPAPASACSVVAGKNKAILALGPGGNEMYTFDELEKDNPNLKALDLILAAWDEGADTGVLPEQMAYAALFTALTDLVSIYGEDAVVKLTRGLEKRIDLGEFTLNRNHQ